MQVQNASAANVCRLIICYEASRVGIKFCSIENECKLGISWIVFEIPKKKYICDYISFHVSLCISIVCVYKINDDELSKSNKEVIL